MGLAQEKRTLKVREALRVGRALKLVWSISPRLTVASTVLMVLQGLVPLASVVCRDSRVAATGTSAFRHYLRMPITSSASTLTFAAVATLLLRPVRSISTVWSPGVRKPLDHTDCL